MPAAYSIIVPAYNESAELPATLAAIRRAMAAVDLPGECVVVDNNSSDQTAAIARASGADQVVFEPVNQIARARNAGAAASTGERLVFVDADTRIEPELLRAALDRLASGTCVGGGARIAFEGEVGRVGRLGIAAWALISRRARIAAGSFLFCRRDAFEAVGGFDQTLYASEEVRFSRQLKRWGRGWSFDILQEPPALTSARKLQWYSGPQILGWTLRMILLPLAVRSRRLCGFWYERPLDRQKDNDHR